MELKNNVTTELLDLVRRVASHLNYQFSLPKCVDEEDLYQWGCIGLLECLKTYKEDKDVELSAWCWMKVKWYIIDELRKATRSRGTNVNIFHECSFEDVTTDSEGCTILDVMPVREKLADEIYELEHDYDVLLSMLDARSQYIVDRHFKDGLSYEDVGVEIQRCGSRVSQLMNEILEGLRCEIT